MDLLLTRLIKLHKWRQAISFSTVFLSIKHISKLWFNGKLYKTAFGWLLPTATCYADFALKMLMKEQQHSSPVEWGFNQAKEEFLELTHTELKLWTFFYIFMFNCNYSPQVVSQYK